MEPTGYDNVLFTFRSGSEVAAETVVELFRRWPEASIDLWDEEDSTLGEKFSGAASAEACSRAALRLRHGAIMIYTEERFRSLHDEFGYTVDWEGGSFALVFRRRTGVRFDLGRLSEKQADDRGKIGFPKPYGAVFASPEVMEITVVTPEDPADDAFSKQVFDLVVARCLAPCR